MNKEGFLAKAKGSSCFISESKILSQLAELDKAVIISMYDLNFFLIYFSKIKEEILKMKRSDLYHIEIGEGGVCSVEVLGNHNNMNESFIINLVNSKFKNYSGYCFVVDSGMQYLYSNGKIDENVEACLEKTKSMQEKLDILKPVSSLKEVFDHFKIDCIHNKSLHSKCFDALTKKVKSNIQEQKLRNILLTYLKKKMRGEVCVEFCTDYVNDEESVDIYLNDGIERAIIEVKFSLAEKYYDGTNYSLTTRVGDGIKQLDKYARHLAKDARLVDYGYVYMFYINDMKMKTIESHIENKIKELFDELSNEVKSIFESVVLNDMKLWNIAS